MTWLFLVYIWKPRLIPHGKLPATSLVFLVWYPRDNRLDCLVRGKSQIKLPYHDESRSSVSSVAASACLAEHFFFREARFSVWRFRPLGGKVCTSVQPRIQIPNVTHIQTLRMPLAGEYVTAYDTLLLDERRPGVLQGSCFVRECKGGGERIGVRPVLDCRLQDCTRWLLCESPRAVDIC